MNDRIDELVQQVMDVFAHSQNPETDEWELSGDLDQYPSYVALTELATIAREAETEADKWRKVAETVAKIAADLSEELVGAGAGPGEFMDEALRRILIKQEEIK